MSDNIAPRFSKITLEILASDDIKKIASEWKDYHKKPVSKVGLKKQILSIFSAVKV